MIPYEDLNTQNHRITELSSVLSVLLKDRILCDSETCCKLFYHYMALVNEHMQEVDSGSYADLLQHKSNEANSTARNFMRGSMVIKKIMNQYAKKWCDKKSHSLSIGNRHDEFLQETDEMFGMVLQRIQDETENLYPMVRKISNA